MTIKTKSILTSGWTKAELEALERLRKALGTDKSKALRLVVRQADKTKALEELGAETINLIIKKEGD